MSKKTFTLFIILLLAIIGAGFWYFFLRSPEAGQQTPGGNVEDPNLFPFGQGGVTPGEDTQGGSNNGQGGGSIDLSGGTDGSLPYLRKIWKDPTAGATFTSSGSSTESIRFVDRATGHIYDAPLAALGETKISNITIPQIYEALWASNGKEAIFRYLKDDSIQSFYAAVSTSTDPSSAIEGYFLTEGIKEMAVAGSRLLYLNPSSASGNVVLSNINGSGKVSVMSSDLREWLISWSGGNSAFIGSRPSGTVKGFGYILNISTGATTKASDGVPGLTGTVNAEGTFAFLSAHERNGIASASYEVSSNKTTTLPLKTLSEKCVWSSVDESVIYCAVPESVAQGTYPDDWYQGAVTFEDSLWKIDLATGDTSVLLDPRIEALEDFDMIRLSLSPDDSYILFTNKKDMSLWLFRLK